MSQRDAVVAAPRPAMTLILRTAAGIEHPIIDAADLGRLLDAEGDKAATIGRAVLLAVRVIERAAGDVRAEALRAMGSRGAVRVGERWLWREEIRSNATLAREVLDALTGAACERCGERDGTVIAESDPQPDPKTGYVDARRLCRGCAGAAR